MKGERIKANLEVSAFGYWLVAGTIFEMEKILLAFIIIIIILIIINKAYSN